MLHAPGNGKYNVRQGRRRGHEQLRNHAELKFHESFVSFPGIGVTHYRIGKNKPGGLDGEWLLIQDRLDHGIRRDKSRALGHFELIAENAFRFPGIFAQQKDATGPGKRRRSEKYVSTR